MQIFNQTILRDLSLNESRYQFNMIGPIFQVQFGHAGSCANSDRETATAKNEAFKAAGVSVPETFDSLNSIIK